MEGDRMKKSLALGMIGASWLAFAAAPEFEKTIEDAAKLPHPRLFASAGDFDAAKAYLTQTGTPNAYAARRVIARADDLLDKPVLERKQIGKRLLDVSRKELYRL